MTVILEYVFRNGNDYYPKENMILGTFFKTLYYSEKWI